MATANFKTMEYGMPLVVGGTEYFEDIKAAEELAENFTENLKYHDITVVGGYYSGFQFYVEEKYSNKFDLDKQSIYCIDNYDAHYYFDVCKSVAIREADREKRKIRKWLESLENHGYEIIVCIGRFSNGEAIYEKRTPRTRLLAAVRA